MSAPANDAIMFCAEKEGAHTSGTSPSISLFSGILPPMFLGKLFMTVVKLRLEIPKAHTSKGWVKFEMCVDS